VLEDIAADLRKNYKVDEFFYPSISMDIDLPQGFKGEVDNVTEILEKNGFATTSENAFQILTLKKNLLAKYTDKVEGRKVVTEYNKLLGKKEPVGSIVSPEYFLVSGLIAIFLYGLARFVGSFTDEAGKLAARKLFDKAETRKQLMKELNLNVNEYNLLGKEIVIIINEDSKSIEAIRKKLRKQR
jgi:hypothetical protein